MDGVTVFLLSVVVYSTLPLLYALWQGPSRFLLFFVHLAGVLALGGILGAQYRLTLPGDVTMLAGQISYGGFIYATMILFVVGRDIRLVRGVILLVIAVNVLKASIFAISHEALTSDAVVNPSGVPAEVFDQSISVVLIGGTLIIVELLLLLGVLEVTKTRISSWAMTPVYVLTLVGILVLDGVLFPTAILGPGDAWPDTVLSGVEAKAYLAAAYAVPLTLFVLAYRPVMQRFESEPVRLRNLFVVNRDDLLETLDQQQAELDEQRARLLQSTAVTGRATATTAGLLGSAHHSLLVVTDEDLMITRVSSGTTRVLGFTERELVGTSLASLHDPAVWRAHAEQAGVPPDQVSDPLTVATALARSGPGVDWEFRTKDEGSRTVSYSITAIQDDGSIVGFLGAGEDVTDRVRTERAVAAALQRENQAVLRLQEVDQLKADLIGNVSHELRTPLTSVNGYLELVTEGEFGALNNEQRHALDRIASNTERLKRLVDDLLTVAASEAGTFTLDLASVDLREMVLSVGDLLQELCRGRDVRLEIVTGDEPVPLLADASALERLLINLASNAIKFTEGRGTVTIEVTPVPGAGGRQPGGRLVVRDTGIGIAPEAQSQLFARFYRAPEAAGRAIPGSGLGLSIVRSIVEAHGGEIQLDSELGVGTAVTVFLPSDPGTDFSPLAQALPHRRD